MKKYNLLNYLPTITLAIIILLLSLMPSDNKEQPFFYFQGLDKLIHGIIYAVLTIFFLNDYLKRNFFLKNKLILLAISILFYSILMEFLQLLLVTSRSGEYEDVLANLAGIIIGLIIIWIFRKPKS